MARARQASATTTLYLRGMPTDVVRHAKAEAAKRGVTIAALVADALAQVTTVRPRAERSTSLRGDAAWFEQHRAALVAEYRGEYLAIIDSSVVDHDRDFDVLASRIFDRFGPRTVFMPRALEPERERPTIHLRSPRLRARASRPARDGQRIR